MLKPNPYILLSCLLLWFSGVIANDSKMFTDFEGQPRSIDEYLSKQQWTVLMIWRHDCHVCNEEAAGYAFFHDDNEHAQVLGLSMDGINNKHGAEKFITNHDLPFNNLLGEPAEVAAYYQRMTGQHFRGTPSFLVFNPTGKLMAAQGSAVPPDVISQFIESRSNADESGS